MANTNTDYAEVEAINHVLGLADALTLFTSNPDFETGAGGVEASGGGYARKTIAFTPAAGASGATSGPTVDQVWTVGAGLLPGTYTGWGVYNTASGKLVFGEALVPSRVLPNTGDTITFPAGCITYTAT